MEQAISRLVQEIRKQLKEEIRKENKKEQTVRKNTVQKTKKRAISSTPQPKDEVRESLNQIQEEIRMIRISLSRLEQKKPQATASNFSQSMNLSHYRVPSHLDDHQMRQVLYNPEEASTQHQPRHKRRSHYDQVYEEAEKRIEETGRTSHNARSKISKLIQRDRLVGSSMSQHSY